MLFHELSHDAGVYARYFASLSHRELRRRREAGEHVSGAHSEPHLNGVATLVPAIGEAYGFSTKVILLGRFAAQFHDIERSEREDLGDEDERRSAYRAVTTLSELQKIFPTSEEERNAVHYAIMYHGRPPSFFTDSERREKSPEDLNEQVHVMLYVADGLQKLGAPLINRRSAFVGGERRTTGDLQGMQYEGQPIDAVHAILLESGVRLGWKGTEGVYPQRLAEFIRPAFAVQRDWVSGLLAARGWDMVGWAHALWNTRNEREQISLT